MALLWLILLAVATVGQSPALPAERFVATWSDGSRTTSEEVRDWGTSGDAPRLGDRPLFNAANPARSLVDTTQQVASADGPWIEFVGGDRLPGRVIGPATANSFLLVEPRVAINMPGMQSREQLRVLPGMIQRIVWRATGHAYRPGTALFQDGRRIVFRAVRWSDEAVRLLTDQGPQTVSLHELDELHLPQGDRWDAYYSQLAALSPQGDSRLMRVTTADGLEATTSLERFQPRSLGDARNPDNWYHVVQPAWSLDTLYLAHRKVVERSFFAPHQVPLTWLEPVRSEHRAMLSGAWGHAQRNVNVEGGPLRNAGRDYRWGFGVHAQHELEFALPASARAFRTRVGLDQLVGPGGSIRARIFVGSQSGELLFESGLLVGSQTYADTGRLPLSITGRESRLTLVADAAANEHGPNIDPLDIRDVCDWLEPELELDPQQVHDALTSRVPMSFPALEGWTLDGSCGTDWRVGFFLDPLERPAPNFRPILKPLGGPIKLRRTVNVAEGRDALALHLRQIGGDAPLWNIEVSVRGHRLTELPIPSTTSSPTVCPVIIDLAAYRGREVEVQVKLIPRIEQTAIEWQTGSLTAQPAGE